MYTISPKCPNCGAALPSGSTDCQYCGARIELAPTLQQMRLLGFPCPNCGTLADKGSRFCSNCGQTLLIKCPGCRTDIPLSAHVCPKCGLNRAAVALIREAEEKRKSIDSQTTTRLEQVQQQIAQHESLRRVKDRLSLEAERLEVDAAQLGQTASNLSGRAAAILGAAFVIPLAFCVLVHLATAALGKGNAWGISCLGGIPAFLVVAAVSARHYVKSQNARRKADTLRNKASDMRTPDAWRKYATPDETKAIETVFEWGKQEESRILQESEAERAKVDRWLEESFNALK